MPTPQSILDTIGDTALVELRHVIPQGAGRILVKTEFQNPSGSMKDRMALAMIEAAEADGRLEPGQTVVEYTGGSTGVSLAQVCCAKRYPLHIVTSDAFSQEKRQHMATLGAELTLIASASGGMDKALTLDMIDAARDITQRTNGFWTDQLNNADQLNGYDRMGDEIWEQTGGRIDAFVQGVGTAGSVTGVGRSLVARRPATLIVAVEPAESAVLGGGASGSHKIEGMGVGFVPPLWQPDLVGRIIPVSAADAMAMARRLSSEEAIFAGTSTGSNVIAAIQVATELGPEATVVTIACDSGIKYLSTELYAPA